MRCYASQRACTQLISNVVSSVTQSAMLLVCDRPAWREHTVGVACIIEGDLARTCLCSWAVAFQYCRRLPIMQTGEHILLIKPFPLSFFCYSVPLPSKKYNESVVRQHFSSSVQGPWRLPSLFYWIDCIPWLVMIRFMLSEVNIKITKYVLHWSEGQNGLSHSSLACCVPASC